MKILQIHNRYRLAGGEDTVVSTEATILRNAGHDVVQYTEQNPAGAIASSLDLLRAPWNRSAAKRIESVVRTHQPDIAHVHNTWFHLSPSIFRSIRAAGSPVVLTLHNYRLICSNGLLLRDGQVCELCPTAQSTLSAVRYRCYRRSFVQSAVAAATISYNRWQATWERDVDLLLVLTEFARAKLIEAGFPAGQIAVKPNFVSDPGARIQPVEDSGSVLFVGRLSLEKGAQILIDAWERAKPAGLTLKIIGDGPLMPQLRERSIPGVLLMGSLASEEVTREMLTARALVLPSIWYEGLSMVLLEALAAGLPVLASNLGAMPEILKQLGPEWLATENDSRSLARALSIMQDSCAVTEAGRAARSTYDSSYSPEAGLRLLQQVYRDVVGTAGGAGLSTDLDVGTRA